MAEPLELGAAKAMLALASPPVATTLVGASGAPAGVTADEAVEAGLAPTPLVAVTVTV